MPAARPTKQQIERAIAAWKSAGLAVGAVEISTDGTIRIEAPPVLVAPNRDRPQDTREPIAWT